jgi:YidC/Oxa1 family membrane protein insertase
MRKTLIMLVLLLSVFTLSLMGADLITQEGTNTLIVSGKTLRIVIDIEKGLLTGVTSFADNKGVEFYAYNESLGKDGFNIFDQQGNELLPQSFSRTTDAEGNVVVDFFYQQGRKSFVILNSPYYDFNVVVDFNQSVEVALPFISYNNQTLGPDSSYYLTYDKFSGQKTLFAIASQQGSFKFQRYASDSGKGILEVFAGPMRLIHVKEALPEYYSALVKDLEGFGAVNFFSWIYHGIVYFLFWLYQWSGNFGWALILFTIATRFVLYPLYHIQTKPMLMMRMLQPEIEKIKNRYKDPKRQQEAMMALYKEKGYNPASSCFPILIIQLPILIILYNAIRYFSEVMAYTPGFLIWSDLSVGDFIQNIPFIIITIVVGVFSSLLTAQDARSARSGVIMQLIFPILFGTFPSGLLLYWTTQSVLQLLISWVVYKRHGIKGLTLRQMLGLPEKPAK